MQLKRATALPCCVHRMGQGPSTTSARRTPDDATLLPSGGMAAGPGGNLAWAGAGAVGSYPALATSSSSGRPMPLGGLHQAIGTAQAGTATAPSATGAAALGSALASTVATSSGAAPAPSAGHSQVRSQAMHKGTTLIPGWSRALSTQQLQIECQKVNNPQQRSPAQVGKESLAVLEMEVMKFVAYCGGVTLKFRIDECSSTSVNSVTWGLTSTRPCPALQNLHAAGGRAGITDAAAGGSQASLPAPAQGKTEAAGGPAASTAPRQGSPLPASQAVAGATLQIDNASRKQMHMICTLGQPISVSAMDVLTIDLAPREDRQPVILATLKCNDTVVLQQALPCSTISSIQLYPFVSLQAGMAVSLHKAVTPSPLFTWYLANPDTRSEANFAELDTCVRYTSQPGAAPQVSQPQASALELLGSVTFNSGRHRWTLQLDNYSTRPTHIFVGVVGPGYEPANPALAGLGPSSSSGSLAGGAALRHAPNGGASTSGAAQAAAGANAGEASDSGTQADAGVASTSSAHSSSLDVASMAAAPVPAHKWGAWIRLPGTGGPAAPQHCPPPPATADGTLAHSAESTSAHCFITVDLDMNVGYVRFFRNGHLIGSAFQGLTGPIAPTLAFMQGTSLSCQAGLVNLTKLEQLDLSWNPDKCSGDLKLTGLTVSKVAEMYGDYSTVLASQGFISGVHLWLVKVVNLSEPDSIFIGVCRGCMPLDQDPQDLRDRTYYLSNGVIRVGGRRVATNAANFTKGDVVGVVLDADQGEIVFFRNGVEQGRARGIRGRLYPFVSCDSEADQVCLLGSYSLLLNRMPRQLADMEWDTMHHGSDLELSSNCLTANKTSSSAPSTVRGTILYTGTGYHEFHVILDSVGPDGLWVGVAPPNVDPNAIVGDVGAGWALHTDGDKRHNGKEEEYAAPLRNGDVLTVSLDVRKGSLRFSRNGQSLGDAFFGITFPLVAAVTLASEESKVTIQNRPTVLNTGEYTGELRWDEARAGKDLHVIDGLTVTKMANDGGDYATVLGTLCLASGQHSWNVYINHVEDSNLFIGVSVGGHDLNADPQEMKHRTYYLSNGTIRVAGKLVTRCAEPYAEGDLVTLQLDMEQHHISFLKNGVLQGAGDGLPDEVWPYVSLDNVMDSITLHSSSMFIDLAQSLRWNPSKACRAALVSQDGQSVTLKPLPGGEEATGQATVMGVREYSRTEVHTWIVRFEQPSGLPPSNFLVGLAPPNMDLVKSLGEEGCGIGLDYYGYFYVNGRYFHASNLANWSSVAKPVRGSTAKHKGKALPVFTFAEGRCEVMLTLDLREGTLRFTHQGRSIGTIASVKGPMHAAVTLTTSKQTAVILPGPIGENEHTNEELVHVLRAKGCQMSPRVESAMLLVPRDLFVPRDRHREAFRDSKVAMRMADGSTLTLPPPSFVAKALEHLDVKPGKTFLDVGCGTGYVTALAACLLGDGATSSVYGVECVSSRLEQARGNIKALRDRLSAVAGGGGSAALLAAGGGGSGAGPSTSTAVPPLSSPSASALSLAGQVLGDPHKALSCVDLTLSNVLIPECMDGLTFDTLYCDASLSEEDLPMFLSLLKQRGRMVVVLEEEAVLITRTGDDAHEFSQEVIAHVGDFGELEDPTPWEVQEAIKRMKDRERRRGMEQAKSEIMSLRSYEYVEMQQRVQAAMQRISELEGMLQRDPSLRSPMRASAMAGGGAAFGLPSRLGSGALAASAELLPGSARSPLRASSALDDVRSVVRDKSRRGLRMSPCSSLGLMSPGPEGGVWKDASLYGGGEGSARSRSKDVIPEPPDHLLHATAPSTPGSTFNLGPLFASQVSMPQHTFDDILDSMSVQMFSQEQIAAMVAGAEPMQVEGRDVYPGSYKGVRVRVWRAAISHSVSYLELRRAYSKYCIAHPNICAVLGVCILAEPRGASFSALMPGGAAAALAPSPLVAHGSLDVGGLPDCGGSASPSPSMSGLQQQQQHSLWVVEEAFGEESLHVRLERGLLSWQQVIKVATDICKALAFLQDMKRSNAGGLPSLPDSDVDPDDADVPAGPSADAVLSAYALRTVVTPSNVQVDSQSTKVSVLPALLNHLESALCDPMAPSPPALAPQTPGGGGGLGLYLPGAAAAALGLSPSGSAAPLHCDMAYMDPHSLFSEASAPSFYAFGVVLLQLLTEQGPLGLLSAVREAMDNGSLLNLVPRMPANSDMLAWALGYCQLAIKCTQPQGISNLETEVLPALEELSAKLNQLGTSAMSWEQVEEMLMLPLQPRSRSLTANRRWVRQDFRMRRKMFLEEVAKLAVEGPVHKMEIRRARCFKDSMGVFSGKGHAVWRQPLKVTFMGEAGMDSGGVTREWFCALSSAISRNSPDLFWNVGPQKNQLYISPLSNSPSHLKKFQFVGLFMAKAILESAARGKELGTITLNLNLCEPFWKLLLGIPLNLMDLQLMDPTEFRSLMSLLDMDIDGLIFEAFTWNFHHSNLPTAAQAQAAAGGQAVPHAMQAQQQQGQGSVAAAAAGGGDDAESCANTPTAGAAAASSSSFAPSSSGAGAAAAGASGPSFSASPAPSLAAAAASSASPFSGNTDEDTAVTVIPLKPGGTHVRVSNHNKREYVLLKAHKMLVGTIEAQMTSIIDAFHSLIPRDLLDKYSFTSMEMQLLVCGEQRVDIQDLKRSCKYEDGYTGQEPIIAWFWEVVEAFDDAQRRQLLQFWSGSDGMPAEGFGPLDPAFHIVAVERMYDANDTTARLPAAHTCFRQLDLPRYRSLEEVREKVVTAMTLGQGYMGIS